jgi:galactokinase
MPSPDGPRAAPPAAGFERVISLFHRSYGVAPAVVASAPGRVNLIGEHLDYNGGPVLPFAIDRRTWVAAALAPEFSLVSSEPGCSPVTRAGGPARGDWSDYVMGVVRELGERAVVPGARIAVASEVLPGAGLSSSAALAVASAAALAHLAGVELGPGALAEAAFGAEHDYVGVRCGRMDQTVVAHAVEGTALFLDTATGVAATCPFPLGVWIVPTGVAHALADGQYNARRSECEAALERCRTRWPELAALAALDPSHLPEALALLPAPLDRRVRHVVTETARTREVRRLLGAGDLAQVGRLLVAGHASLRDDYESSVAEADFLVETAVEHGALGARLTGAGWGGSVIMLVSDDIEADVVARTVAGFDRRFGRKPAAWRTRAAGGVRLDLTESP